MDAEAIWQWGFVERSLLQLKRVMLSCPGMNSSVSMSRAGLEALALRFTDAFNRDDLDGVMQYFAEDAVYVTYDGLEARGRAAIREAFVPQFRGDFGRIRFLTEDLLVDESTGKVVLRWRCQHDLSRLWGLPGPVGLKQLFYRGLYGRAFGWQGLDVLHFSQELLRHKRTYAQAKLPLVHRGTP